MDYRSVSVEALERRQLFAGVSLLTHGWNGRLAGFVNHAAAEITTRLGGPSHVAQYTLRVSPDSNGNLSVTNVTHKDGTATADSVDTGEIIILADWINISTDSRYSAESIGNAFADYMEHESLDGVRLAELPIHEMGLSRGTAILDGLAKSLGRAGVWVDQITYLDPRPIFVMGDPVPIVYDNVAFADNYWRLDVSGEEAKSGMHVDGAYNLYQQFINDHADGYELVHLAPASYYVATINLNTHDGGEGPIYDDWFGNTADKPARDKTGFYYSNIIGGPRPLDGVWAASGGSGQRTASGSDGPQFPNITDLRPTSSNISSGDPMQIKYIQQDRDSGATVTFYLDRDRNPYNDNFANTLGQSTFGANGAITNGTYTASTAGVAKGSYWLAAKVVDDGGRTRYAYSRSVNISGPVAFDPFRPTFGPDHILRVGGTNDNDAIRISRSPSQPDRLVVDINGHIYRYNADSIPTIYVYGKAGDDVISLNEKYGAIFSNTRLMGDAGNDKIMAGSGNDSLYGGDGNDWIYGGAGRDRITGDLGTDRLYGNTGKDWFMGSKRVELKDFRTGDLLVELA